MRTSSHPGENWLKSLRRKLLPNGLATMSHGSQLGATSMQQVRFCRIKRPATTCTIKSRPSSSTYTVLSFVALNRSSSSTGLIYETFSTRAPRLADRWLGTDTPTLLSHTDHANQLTGFARYLRDLPFVEPSADNPAHPRRILSEATKIAGQQGILLVGVGGVGKTRTLLEVANLAASVGWRVLHTAGWGRGLTQDELTGETLDGRADTLLVVDYLSQLKEIDFSWVRARLLPAVRQRGIKFGIVAAERPAHVAQADDHRRRYFKSIRLEPDTAQTEQIIETMLDHAAAHAVQVLGRERVRGLAGTRPIIALFVMQELERRASTELGRGRTSATPRSTDLLDWLSARLDEDSLAPPPPLSIWARSNSGPELLASAAVLCAAPQPRQILVDVATQVLTSLGGATPAASGTDGAHVIDVLLDLGWLELRAGVLGVAHEVVAEEVLLRALHDGAHDGFTKRALWHILTPSARSPKTLTHTTIVLERIADADPKAAQFLGTSIPQWVIEHASSIGSSLVSAEGDVADMVIRALFARKQWTDSASNHYDEIVRPFLRQHGMRRNAALPLVNLLGHARLSKANAAHLCSEAISWCKTHLDDETACLVSRIMLMRSDIPNEVARVATEVAFIIAMRDHEEGRMPLIGALLARSELDRAQGQELIRLVHRDLVSYARRRGALLGNSSSNVVEHFEMVLFVKNLLEHHDIPPGLESDVLNCAVASLWHWRRGEGASWLLPAMLRRYAELGPRLRLVRKLARRWLNSRATTRAAGGVLAAVCNKPESLEKPTILGEAVLAWLDRHGTTAEAAVVLTAALDSACLREDVKQRVEVEASQWLARHALTPGTESIIIALLNRPNLSKEVVGMVTSQAAAWVEQNLESVRLGFVLDLLLKRNDLDAELKIILVDRSIQWLTHHTNEEAALLAVRAVMHVSDLPTPQFEETIRLALLLIDHHQEHWVTGGTLLPIFARMHRVKAQPISDSIYLDLVNATIGWLRQHEGSPMFGAVVTAFVHSGSFPIAAAVHVVEPAFKWLLSPGEKSGFEVWTVKRILKYCAENSSSEHWATMRRLCESIIESLSEREPGEGLLAELGLAANSASQPS